MKLRYGKYFKASPESLNDSISQSIAKGEYYQQLSKGNRLMKPIVKVGYDGDDFVKNLLTVVIQWEIYKIPRFLARYLMKNSKPGRPKFQN